MPEALHLDFETRSPLNLKKCGVYRYVAHPATSVLCVHMRCGDRALTLFDPRLAPDWVLDVLGNPEVEVHAHNAAFERLVLQHICHPRYDWPWVATERFRCTAMRASRLALPRALDKAAEALGLGERKMEGGNRVMHRLSKPIGHGGNGFQYDDHPVKLERLAAYCQQDVVVEQAIAQVTLAPTPEEERLYQLTERINDRGVRVDVPLVKQLIWRANECTAELNARLQIITGGAVKALTQVAPLKRWIERETGVILETLRKEDMEQLTHEADVHGFPEHVKQALQIRAEGAKSSVSKLIAILERVSTDGRIHGAFVHHGASTGRYTSMGVQLQNLRRDTLKDFKKDIKGIGGFTLDDISRTIRACFIPSPGCLFVDADYSAIEARGVAWLAQAKILLRTYKQKADPYCQMGGVIYGKPVTKADEEERWVGKQTVLGCGYGMGAAKFQAQCEKFGKSVPEKLAQASITAYRSEYPEIPRLWYDVGDAAIRAVETNRTVQCARDRITFKVAHGYLQMRLPSGRRLFYRHPQIVWRDKFNSGRERPELTFMAEHPITRQWHRESTWGGKLVENAVQAIARDLLFQAMERLEEGYITPIVLSVHDQVVCEVLAGEAEYAKNKVQQIMEDVPNWAADFPVEAEPKITERFGK